MRQLALDRVRLDDPCVRLLVALLQVLDLDEPALLRAAAERPHELLLGVGDARGAGVCASSNWPKVSSSLRRTRASGVFASAAIVGPTYSIASRIARASSGVSFGARRKTSP